ncbi:TonB-dependent receptor plug domain-containing protein [Hyphomonas sp.]|uniref:TonB-dependent receptor plug domain-containing protein n=1 Tax=Hyphomonas sp. TaxID=87 RepID=UPI00352956B8
MAVSHTLLPGFAAMLAAGLTSLPAAAEPDTGTPITSGSDYAPADFAQYNPQTALDMVNRIPGFSIQRDDDGSRGFGQATGNVLINGQRVSGKSNGAEAALGRISATKVVRIEVVDGTTLDIPGLSGQVVNVTTDGEGGVSGTWRWRSRIREGITPYFHEAVVTLSGGDESLSWSVEANSLPRRSAHAGWETITTPEGALLERRKEDLTNISDNVSVSGSLAWKPPSGVVANLNGRVGIYQFDRKETSKTFPVGEPEGRRLFLSGEDEWNAELGGDYEFGFGPGRLKIIGLARRENSPFNDTFRAGTIDGADFAETRFRQTIDEGEYIGRGEYAWNTGQGRDWQVSLENAFNFLDAETGSSIAMDGGPFEVISLPGANSRVEENRWEAAVTYGRPLSADLRLQVSLGAEYSELTQSGDNANAREFTRPKGFASLSWQADPKLKLTARIDREVGQLDFFDFISSVNLDADSGDSGNANIVPQQAWKWSLQAEKDFGDWGAATLNTYYSDIEDIVDRVPIGMGDGPGNLDTAREIGITLDSTLKLAKLGIPGGELTSYAEWFDSEVTDPLTGQTRPINDSPNYYLNIEFRQDVPGTDWAWGGFLERFERNHYYQLSERGVQISTPGYGSVFVEHKDILGLTGNFSIGNLLNQKDNFRREIYQGNRLGPITSIEDRTRRFGPVLLFELRGTF